MDTGLKNIFSLLRIPQWSKAVFVFMGVIYSHALLQDWLRAIYAAVAFCLIASAVYIYNDLQDLAEDKLHPHKSRRPLANNLVSKAFAKKILLLLVLAGYGISLAISYRLTFILSAYIVINLAYNHGLRQVPIGDVLCIASGFMLRILAGTFGIGLPITWWLTLTATLLSLYIALCKRRLEMQLNLGFSGRSVLKKYDSQQLDGLIRWIAISALLFYMFYTFYARDNSGYFLLTIPFAIMGLWRFTQLVTKARSQPISFFTPRPLATTQVDSDILMRHHSAVMPAEAVCATDDPVVLFLTDALSCLNLAVFFLLTLNALWR